MEAGEDTLKVHELAEYRGAVVTHLWHIEVANILGNKLKNAAITAVTLKNALDLLAATPIETDQHQPRIGDILPLMAASHRDSGQEAQSRKGSNRPPIPTRTPLTLCTS